MKTQRYYATPEEEIPKLGGHRIGFYYVEDEEGNDVLGISLDKTVRLAVEKLKVIINVGRIG